PFYWSGFVLQGEWRRGRGQGKARDDRVRKKRADVNSVLILRKVRVPDRRRPAILPALRRAAWSGCARGGAGAALPLDGGRGRSSRRAAWRAGGGHARTAALGSAATGSAAVAAALFAAGAAVS